MCIRDRCDIHGKAGVISPFSGDLISVVFCAPCGLPCGDGEAGMLRLGGVGYLVEDIKFIFRPYDHLVCDPQLLHIANGPFGHIPGILVKGPVGRTINDHHVSDHGEGGNLCKGINCGRIQVGHENHVAALHRGIAVIGAVESNPVLHSLLVEPVSYTHLDGYKRQGDGRDQFSVFIAQCHGETVNFGLDQKGDPLP